MNINYYDPAVIISASVVALLIIVAIVFFIARHRANRRTAELRAVFGPEYDAAVREYGSKRKAEARLTARLKRVEQMKLRPFSEIERTRFLTEWEAIQARFIDHPRGAVTEADEMIHSILSARGYPTSAFEQRAADISVHHAKMVDPFRRANAIVARAGKNEATTEELRTAMILYRAMLEEQLQAPATDAARSAAVAA